MSCQLKLSAKHCYGFMEYKTFHEFAAFKMREKELI